MKAKELGKTVECFLAEEAAVTAIEYALLAALIFTVIVVSVGLVGNAVEALFITVAAGF